MQNIREKILELIKNEKGRPIPSGIVYKKLENIFPSKKQVYGEIDKLLDDGILKNISNKLVLEYENSEIDLSSSFDGYIFLNTKNDGFVKRIGSDSIEVYVNKKNLNSALNGDKIRCALMQKENDSKRLKDGVVLEVLERNKDFFTATFLKDSNDQYKVIADDNKMTMPIILDDISGLVDGHKILVKLSKIEETQAYGTVSKIIGHRNSVGVDILSIVYDNGLTPEFSDEVLEASKHFKIDINEKEISRRVDLRNLNIITIDPKTSKDLDDAIYVEKIEDNFKLFVSIADVSHYVTNDSIVDQEAFKRGTSVYLVNQVIPMLPQILSNDLCSLNPKVDRLSMTCEMLINKKGEFLNIKVYPSMINSKRQFAYEEVNAFFSDNKSLKNDSEDIKKMLLTSFDLYKILKTAREEKGYINFDVPEPKIILDKNEKIIDIKKKETGEAQMLIESFMVAANEAVTIEFNKHHKKFVYRVHDKPDEKKLNALKIEAKKLDFKIDNNIKDIQPNTIAKWLLENKDNPKKDLINMILLRTMAKAKYSTLNIGHFGLASNYYTHFTSPIRRYPDLIVHRLFRMFLLEKDDYKNEDRSNLMNKLKDICDHSSKSEIIAVETEREVNSMKFAEYMEDHIGSEFDGFVSYVTNFGVFIQLENTIEGLAKPEKILNSFYIYDANEQWYIERDKKTILTLGTKTRIKVIGANKLTKKIDFEIVKIY